jgi:hypothetical protein
VSKQAFRIYYENRLRRLTPECQSPRTRYVTTGVKRVAFLLASGLCAALVLPASAVAQSSTLPPGNSGIDQYQENVPGPGGDKAIGQSGADDEGGGGGGALSPADEGGGGGGALSPALERKLAARGPAGKAVADAVAATAPGRLVGEEVPGGSSGSGMGIALPIILVSTLLAAVAFLLARRRGGGAKPGES